MLDPRRKEKITGSEIAKICGLSPFGGPHDVFLEKLGMSPERKETKEQARGKRLEKYIIDMLREDLQRPISWNKDEILSISTRNRLTAATPDGFAIEHNDHPSAIVEVKSPGVHTAQDWDESIPLYYRAQVIWEMDATGLRHAIVGAWLPDEGLRIYHEQFDECMFCTLLREAEKFWQLVQSKTPPPCPDSNFVKLWYRHTGETMIQNEDLAPKAIELAKLKEELKQIEGRKELLELEIKMAIGNDSGIEGGWGKATWKARKSTSKIDWEGLAKSFSPGQEQINQFTSIIPGPRVFLLKVKGE